MEFEFDDDELARMYADAAYKAMAPEIIKGFRKAMQAISSAPDERDFYALKGLRFEKLQGARSHQHSMRINIKWRLILEFEGKGASKKVRIKGIEDYH